MTKNILKLLFMLMTTSAFAACSSSDSDEPVSGGVTLSATEVNYGCDDTWGEVSVTSRSVWNAKSDVSWLRLKSASGVGGSEKVTFEMDKNTSKEARTALVTITCNGTNTTLKVTQAGTTVEVMDKSQVKDYDKYYFPQGNPNFTTAEAMLRSDSHWSWFRSKQSEHFFVFWEEGFGSDPNASSVPEELRVDVDDLLKKAEQFYETNITKLGMVVTGQGKSYLDQYKMEIYLLYQTEWLATGSGYNDVIGALWVNPSTCKPVGSTIAHEIGHSFQYQTYCDNVKNGAANDFHSGFRYGYEGSNGGCGFWEQCAQWQSYQDYPAEALEGYWTAEWYRQCHRHFEHEWMRYASYYLQYYWTEKHGNKALGRIWNESKYPEDATQAYMRIFLGGDYTAAKKELFEYAQRCISFDFAGTRAYFTNQNNNYSTKLYSENGWYQVAYASCPQPTGFNVVKLEVPNAGTKVTVNIEALKAGSSLAANDPGEQIDGDGKIVGTTRTYNNIGNDQALAYGFVALKKDGSRVYGDMNETAATGKATFIVPASTEYLYLVVQGAPKSYHQCPWDEKESTDMQCPYRIKLEGTDLYGNFSIDETKAPTDVALSYDVKCNAASGDYVQGTIQIQGNDLKKLAQAFVMQPSVMGGNTIAIANGTTATPAEGKIALGLLQPDGNISYTYTANAGFYCKADGKAGSWGEGDPLWFEYDKDQFIITYGHYPAKTEAGKKYVVKPVLVYTKGGKQYKATITLNMQY